MKKTEKRRQRLSLEKKFLLGFVATAAVSWAAFRYLRLIPALAVLLVMAVGAWFLLKKYLVKPIQALTLSVLESHPTKDGFAYQPPDIRTGDELELLSDALRRMADDINDRRSKTGK